jgi:hypothetical protein
MNTRLHSLPANAGRRRAGDGKFSRPAVLPQGAGDTTLNAMLKLVMGKAAKMSAFRASIAAHKNPGTHFSPADLF